MTSGLDKTRAGGRKTQLFEGSKREDHKSKIDKRGRVLEMLFQEKNSRKYHRILHRENNYLQGDITLT